MDFDVSKDRILLSPEVFAVSPGETLPASEFHIGKKAHDASDRIIYNENTGSLFYDPDGEGGAGKIKIAELDLGLNLTADNFICANLVI